MSNGEDWRDEALALQDRVGRLESELRQETAIRRQRDAELHALLAHVLSDQHIARDRLDAEEDTHAALSDSEKGRARLLADALGQGAGGAQGPYERLRLIS